MASCLAVCQARGTTTSQEIDALKNDVREKGRNLQLFTCYIHLLKS